MSMSLEATFSALRDLDTIIAKASGIREVSRIARIENQLRSFVNAQWNRLARRALEQAMRRLRRSGATLTNRDISAISAAVNKEMGKWARRVRERVLDDIEDVYILAREAGHRKGTGKSKASLQYNTRPFSAKPKDIADRADRFPVPQVKVLKAGPEISDIPNFDAVDREAMDALSREQRLWVGAHYGTHVAGPVSDTVRETVIEAGRDRKKAAVLLQRRLRKVLTSVTAPGGFNGTSKQYFEGVVANATTVARVQGQLQSFEKLEFTEYMIVNPIDERTCPVCGHMDNKVFSVQQGKATMEKEIAAETPDGVKKAHPWLSTKAMKDVSPKPGPAGPADAKALSAAGFNLPPFHFRCRCTVDVVV